jgi:hypothetical protein
MATAERTGFDATPMRGGTNMSDRRKAFLACFFRVVLGSIVGALIGVPLIWWGSRWRPYVSEPLEGLAQQIFGVLLSIVGLISGAIAAAVLWARRMRSQGDPRSRVASGALCLYFGLLIGSLLLGWAILRHSSGPPPNRGFFGDL